MTAPPISIVSLGASTPVGRSAPASAAAVRAGICALGEHPYMLDTAGQPMKVARIPWLDPEIQVAGRIATMLTAAVDESLQPLAELPRLNMGLSVALPTQKPGWSEDGERALRAALAARYRGRFSAADFFRSGHAAGFIALETAMHRLYQGEVDAWVLCGADSYVEPETLEWLEECDQLHGAGRLNNAWGFIPGEASGAICLASRSTAERHSLTPIAVVLAAGRAEEVNRIKTETVCTGQGLSLAFRRTLQALPADARVSDVYCDMNGEPYRADEYGFACLRCPERFESASDFVAPADCWGDVAAASAPLLIMLAASALHRGYAKGAYPLAWASSEGGQRGAALLGAAGEA
jgi:3-oxoacyl-[acyl-carrier-protein] synthase I